MKNNLKTVVLLAGLGGLAVTIGGLLGGRGGLFIGLLLGLGIVGFSYWFSDSIALRAAGARIVTAQEAPEVYGIVQRLAERANLPMPTVAVSPAQQPNAFATGRNPKKAVVCVTEGLLQALPRDEVEGVLAHELMHVKNRDILIGSVAAAIATGISYLAQMAMFAAIFGGRGNDDDGPNPLVLLLMTILAPIAAAMIQMAVSRSREFEADRDAAALIGRGEPLARALERIEAYVQQVPMKVNPAQAQAYIANPLSNPKVKKQTAYANLFATHPATSERIRRLREFDRAGRVS